MKSHTRALVSLLALLLVGGLAGCVVRSHPYSAPPQAQYSYVEQRPGWTWIEGRWNWEYNDWAWQEGYWARERPGHYYTQGYWSRRGNRHVWVNGNWHRGTARPGHVRGRRAVSRPPRHNGRRVAPGARTRDHSRPSATPGRSRPAVRRDHSRPNRAHPDRARRPTTRDHSSPASKPGKRSKPQKSRSRRDHR